MNLLQKITPLFAGWNETLIWSVLKGHMGYALADNEETPTAAQLVLGDFCFFAGRPSVPFAASAAAREIVLQNENWSDAIERAWGSLVQRKLRYAIKKEPDVFSREMLQMYIEALPKEYELRLFDKAICEQTVRENWSRDFCTCFSDFNDFLHRGFGVAAILDGQLVSGASSYCVYTSGIEVEIDTAPDQRRRGLALACGARLILEALDRGLYPSWDAYDLRSVALAEKLGYHVDHPYVIYLRR
ncbi:MAG: GNAT family N-acetyltransferase [Christensenella sp.]|nr:GNAT family N-acetyltransferase [Christensenella sp.]